MKIAGGIMNRGIVETSPQSGDMSQSLARTELR